MRSYKESMDQIVMSEALKERIRKQAENKRPAVRPRLVPRYAAVAAVNFAVCLLLLFGTQMRLSDFLIPVQESALPVETAGMAPTPQTTEDNTVSETVQIPQTPASGTASNVQPTPLPGENQDNVAVLPPPAPETDEAQKGNTTISETAAPAAVPNVQGAANADEEQQPDVAPTEATDIPLLQQTQPPVLSSNSGSVTGSSGGGGGGSDEALGNTMLGPIVGAAPGFTSLDALRAACDFTFHAPGTLPAGCQLSDMELLQDNKIQLTYSGSCDFTFLAAPGSGDISGDSGSYEEISTHATGHGVVTFRGRQGLVYTAVWQEGTVSYAIRSAGLTPECMLQIIDGIQ